MQAQTNSSAPANPPRDRAIAISEVLHRVGCGRSRLYIMIRAGEFPGPTKFGRQSRWSERQLDAWLADRFKQH
jgi:excisionase family DNA binding protein